jgi:hypothetical protein
MAIVLDGTNGVTTNSGTVISASTIGVGGATPSTSGAGITFPATQSASSDANTLDDYEEGTWTPTFRATGSALSSVTYTVQNGRYTKIGRTVFIECYLRFTAYSGGSGNASVAGLPFTSVSSSFGCMSIGETAGLTVAGTYYSLQGEVDSSSTNISLLKAAPSSSTTALLLSDVGSATTVYFVFSGTYTASA